ncbi:DDB1- and CUL4-associated factor 5 [Bagarius yarrelli]|uniref:DDB1-and CUL4-associated factor 5 n=1 Tax=Bagarius yarrelli TaxID=175774 RepID=A0A556VV58_BAGYA|nr:DDB1- and CUL4-associated factor 5 [Bagarius yarrelli]
MKEVQGCGMRCSVGFLTRRMMSGSVLLKEDFQRRRLASCNSLYRREMLGHYGCVNAIEFSNNGGQWLVSGNDEQVILHDVERGETLNVFLHDDAVYGLSVSPVNDHVFASSSDDGRVLIWDTREPPHGEPFCLANYPSAFHSVMFNPVEPRLLATANSKEGVGLWDIRKPRSSLLRYGGSLSLQSAMSVRFNRAGTQLLALRRRLPPVLYELHSRLPSFQFDNQGYFNSCTMKSCCFAGDHDQVWSPYQQPDCVGDLEGRVEDKSRSLYTHEEYISLVLNSGSGLSHDYMSQSEQEDPRMMAFFDSLVRREIEGWSSDSDSDLSEGAILQLHARGRGHTHSTNHDESTNQTPPTEATGNRQSDSDHSSSSSSSSPASGSERMNSNSIGSHRWRRVVSRRASTFLLDMVNEDSDSSSFWLDPLPRPRSPSPRENSSLSRTSSPSSSPSSSSTSSTSSDGEEAELQRSRVRQRNAARKQGRTCFSRLDSAHSLQSATDYSTYPKISLHDTTSPSSSGDESWLIRQEGKNKGNEVASSPGSSEKGHTETQLRVCGLYTEVTERPESRIGEREALVVGKSSKDELSQSGLYGNSCVHDENCIDSTLLQSSENVETDSNPAGSRTGKRTRFGSEPEEEESPSEKKLKT